MRQAAPRRYALVLACLLVLALLASQVLLNGPFTRLDLDISLWLAAHRVPWLTQAAMVVSDLHQTRKVLAVTALLVAWRAWRRDWGSVRALGVVPAGMLLNVGLKHAFQRARPSLDEPLVHIVTYSFPSGHAVASTVFWGMGCALVCLHARSRALRAAAVLVAAMMVLAVCFTRVYLGAHYLSDVIAGVAVGTLCVLGFLRFAGR